MFGLNIYREMISEIKDKGFEFRKFHEQTNTKSIYLRHDVDFSVHEAFELAKCESNIDVSSTYFFMVSSNTYNALSQESISIIKEIKNMGHDISLHFDPLVYNNLDWGFSLEKNLFQSTFNVELDIISIHRPGEFLLNNNQKLKGCRHTYEDEFFKNMDYISDSGGRDTKYNIKKLLEKTECKSIHLLTHPIWWTTKYKSPTACIGNWLKNQSMFMREEARRNCKTFRG